MLSKHSHNSHSQSDQQDLREAEFEHKVKVDEGELELLKTQRTDEVSSVLLVKVTL